MMDILWGILAAFGFWTLSTLIAGQIGRFINILYALIGFQIGISNEMIFWFSFIVNILNIILISKYIKEEGLITMAPLYARQAAFVFVIVSLSFYLTNLKQEIHFEFKWWYFLLMLIVIIIGRIDISVSNNIDEE
jgi:hypothetical protein